MSGFNTLADTIPIDFSGQSGATAAGMTAEQLDHYETGAWTPALTGVTSITYSTQVGLYTRIGNIVEVKFRIISTFTQSTILTMSGLPFASGDSGFAIPVSYQNCESGVVPTFYSGSSSASGNFYELNAAGGNWVPPSTGGTPLYLVGGGTYTVQDV